MYHLTRPKSNKLLLFIIAFFLVLWGCDWLEVKEDLKVDTHTASDITPRCAMGGGEISGDEGTTIIRRGVVWSRASGSTIEFYEGKTDEDGGLGEFSSRMFWLFSGSTYYARAYVTDTQGTVYGNEINFQTEPCDIQWGSLTDIDGNEYVTVVIGQQEWMAENLHVTRYADGTPLPKIEDNEAWAALGNNNSDRGYCYLNNDPNSPHGLLYTYAAASNGVSSDANPSGVRGICPDGWHLPSENEWRELIDYIGEKEGLALKSTSGWADEGNGVDVFGFEGQPGGFRHNLTGAFPPNQGFSAYFWSATEDLYGEANIVYLHAWSDFMVRQRNYKSLGLSVRCVKN